MPRPTSAASLTLFRWEKDIAPGWKRVDLVVVEVRDDEGLGGERALHRGHVAAVDAALVHPIGIGAKVLPHRAHRQRISPEQLQAIGDVAGAATELPTHLRHKEGHVEHVDLVRQNVILEAILEDHDVVVGERAANEGPQFSLLQRRARGKTEAGSRPSSGSMHVGVCRSLLHDTRSAVSYRAEPTPSPRSRRFGSDGLPPTPAARVRQDGTWN